MQVSYLVFAKLFQRTKLNKIITHIERISISLFVQAKKDKLWSCQNEFDAFTYIGIYIRFCLCTHCWYHFLYKSCFS